MLYALACGMRYHFDCQEGAAEHLIVCPTRPGGVQTLLTVGAQSVAFGTPSPSVSSGTISYAPMSTMLLPLPSPSPMRWLPARSKALTPALFPVSTAGEGSCRWKSSVMLVTAPQLLTILLAAEAAARAGVMVRVRVEVLIAVMV